MCTHWWLHKLAFMSNLLLQVPIVVFTDAATDAKLKPYLHARSSVELVEVSQLPTAFPFWEKVEAIRTSSDWRQHQSASNPASRPNYNAVVMMKCMAPPSRLNCSQIQSLQVVLAAVSLSCKSLQLQALHVDRRRLLRARSSPTTSPQFFPCATRETASIHNSISLCWRTRHARLHDGWLSHTQRLKTVDACAWEHFFWKCCCYRGGR